MFLFKRKDKHKFIFNVGLLIFKINRGVKLIKIKQNLCYFHKRSGFVSLKNMLKENISCFVYALRFKPNKNILF